MTPRERARKGEGERLRDEILEAAARLLIETGDENAVTIRAVAREVGVTPPAIYLHFADKETLIQEVCHSRFLLLDEHVEKVVAGATDHWDDLRKRGETYIRFGLDNPEQYRLMFMTRPSTVRPPEQVMEASCLGHLIASVRRAQEAGVLRDDLTAEMAAFNLWVAGHGLTSLLIAIPDFPWPPVEELIDSVLSTAAAGLKAP